MGRAGLGIVAMVVVALGLMTSVAQASGYRAGKATKINVMGEWAHPDDDVSIVGPCGVWRERYGVRCGIIMVTRGEGGGNAVGPELGPALGLRRENEDRVAHFRSGTVDIFNLDKVDFFYNQSAPLTRRVWDETDTLRRIVRIVRTTQPDIYLGFTPTLAAGHGNHQQAGRLIWEAVQAAADPTQFPEQLQANGGTLAPWQVKRVFSGGSTKGTGGTATAPDCTTGFVPDAANLDTVVGVWLGYESPYDWVPGNLQGVAPGTAKTWAQAAAEQRVAYPTQSRVMFQGIAEPSCARFAQTAATVPFQPNVNADGAPNPLAGRDDAILDGAVRKDPGGLPLGTTLRLKTEGFFRAPGAPFEATVTAGGQRLRPGRVALSVPPGWTVDAATKRIGPASRRREAKVAFTVTPPKDAAPDTDVRIAARYTSGSASGYTDAVVRVVAPVEGRLVRFGKFAEYEQWLETKAPLARRLGRADAVETMAVGTKKRIEVKLNNRSDRPQSGTVRLGDPSGSTFAAVATQEFADLAPGAERTVTFELENTADALPDPSDPSAQQVTIPIVTTSGGATATDTLRLTLLPKTTIPKVATAPKMDGERDAAYSGPQLDISRRWQGPACESGDCGGPGTNAKVVATDDALFFSINVVDDFQAYAVKPQACVGHWQSDSVEILIDPHGDASRVDGVPDTANTFKLGVFPYTDDPSGSNGNGPNGPCWSRDADNRQGYSTGPLSIGNAPGVEVVSTAKWVGSNETSVDHAYAGGGYALEVKVPLDVLPADLDPNDFGLNITPYDNDNTAIGGAGTLRLIDQSTRLGWSAFGSVQSDPFRWGRASIEGGGAKPTDEVDPVDVSNPNLEGAESPQTIAQSARNGVPISGRAPADSLRVDRVRIGPRAVTMRVRATAAGTLRAYLWAGEIGYIPVWKTSCDPATNPPPDYGLSACLASDGGVPDWGDDQSGRVQASSELKIAPGTRRVRIPVDRDQAQRLRRDGLALVSWIDADDRAQAFAERLGRR